MGNLELINRGIEGRMGFAFLSHSLLFSFHFPSNTNPSRRTLFVTDKHGPGEEKKNALSLSQFKRFCFYMTNPMFLSHNVICVFL